MNNLSFDHIDLSQTKSKHKHEYQEVCTELEPIYGKLIWTVPFKKDVSEWKMREAHRLATARGIYTFPYFYGILKRLP